MLIKCPECELQVSDKATFCPHCGYPMQPDVKQRKPRSKITNGDGSLMGLDRSVKLRTGI